MSRPEKGRAPGGAASFLPGMRIEGPVPTESYGFHARNTYGILCGVKMSETLRVALRLAKANTVAMAVPWDIALLEDENDVA